MEHSASNNSLRSIIPLSGASFEALQELFVYRSIPQNEVFVETGRRSYLEYFIIDGYCRSFLLNPEGDDITLAFFKKHGALSPHITRTKNNISLINFQALTNLELVEFKAEQFLSLMIQNTEIRDFGNTILKNELMQKTAKEIGLASLPAKERLSIFREEYGELENLIPHPLIASYLGITNVSLSRLRSDMNSR